MPTSRTPVLYVIDRAPAFRRKLVEALRQDGGEAYGVESVEQALRLLELFPRRFRVFLDLGRGASEALLRLQGHPRASEVAVLSARLGRTGHRSSGAKGPRRARSRAPAPQPGESEPDGGLSGSGIVVHRARAKQAAITA
jgi:hypothetical protein